MLLLLLLLLLLSSKAQKQPNLYSKRALRPSLPQKRHPVLNNLQVMHTQNPQPTPSLTKEPLCVVVCLKAGVALR